MSLPFDLTTQMLHNLLYENDYCLALTIKNFLAKFGKESEIIHISNPHYSFYSHFCVEFNNYYIDALGIYNKSQYRNRVIPKTENILIRHPLDAKITPEQFLEIIEKGVNITYEEDINLKTGKFYPNVEDAKEMEDVKNFDRSNSMYQLNRRTIQLNDIENIRFIMIRMSPVLIRLINLSN